MAQEIIVVDSQRLNTIQNCAYKYDLSFNNSLQPLQKAEPLERGDLMHKMMEFYYSHKHEIAWTDLVKKCIEHGEQHSVTLDLPVEEVFMTIDTFRQYAEFYRYEPHETLILPNGTRAVEQSGSRVLYEDENLKILYETKIDWICKVANIPTLPVDHKTSKRRSEVNDLSNQFLGYCWMLDVRNIMINKIGFQKTLKPAEKFQRPIISYAGSIIENWVENSVWWIKMLQYHEKSKHWPQNFTSCDKYSGCIFRPICSTTPDNRAFKANELYQITKTWDVGKGLQDD